MRTKTIMLLVAIFVTVASYGQQAPDWNWFQQGCERGQGGLSGNAKDHSILKNGILYTIGGYSKSIEFGDLNATETDELWHCFIVMQDQHTGTYLKLITWQSETIGLTLDVDDYGNMYVSGEYYQRFKFGSYEQFDPTYHLHTSFIMKIAPNNTTPEWVKNFYGVGYMKKIAVIEDEVFLISSANSIYDVELNQTTVVNNMFIMNLSSANGEINWTSHPNTTEAYTGYFHADVTQDGIVVIGPASMDTGGMIDFDGIVESEGMNMDRYFIARYDLSGNCKYVNIITYSGGSGSMLSEYGTAIAVAGEKTKLLLFQDLEYRIKNVATMKVDTLKENGYSQKYLLLTFDASGNLQNESIFNIDMLTWGGSATGGISVKSDKVVFGINFRAWAKIDAEDMFFENTLSYNDNALIVSIDEENNVLWTEFLYGTIDVGIRDVLQENNNAYLVGNMYGDGYVTIDGNQITDAAGTLWSAKLGTGGSLLEPIPATTTTLGIGDTLQVSFVRNGPPIRAFSGSLLTPGLKLIDISIGGVFSNTSFGGFFATATNVDIVTLTLVAMQEFTDDFVIDVNWSESEGTYQIESSVAIPITVNQYREISVLNYQLQGFVGTVVSNATILTTPLRLNYLQGVGLEINCTDIVPQVNPTAMDSTWYYHINGLYSPLWDHNSDGVINLLDVITVGDIIVGNTPGEWKYWQIYNGQILQEHQQNTVVPEFVTAIAIMPVGQSLEVAKKSAKTENTVYFAPGTFTYTANSGNVFVQGAEATANTEFNFVGPNGELFFSPNGIGEVKITATDAFILWDGGIRYTYIPEAATNVVDMEESIAIYPNPATDVLNIKLPGSGNVTISDVTGKIIETKNIQQESSFDLSNLNKGMYFVTIQTKEGTIVRKIIVE